MDDCEGDGLQQPQPGVEMETQISQVDNNIEEEMVMPVQVATMDLVTSSHNDDSGCTSDGDHSEDEDDGGVSHATITRQNTYTVKSAITEIDSKNEQHTELETSLLQRQNTYTITKVMSETQKSSSQVHEMQESQSIASKIEENSELSQSTGTEMVQSLEVSKSIVTEMTQKTETSQMQVTHVVRNSEQSQSNITEMVQNSEQTHLSVTEKVENSEQTASNVIEMLQNSEMVENSEKTESNITEIVQNSELLHVIENVGNSELSKSKVTEKVENSEKTQSYVTVIINKSEQTVSDITKTMDKSELTETPSQVTESVEESELTPEIQSQFTESLHTVEYKYDGDEPVYKEPFTGDNDSDDEREEVESKKESEYVTAEQVRNQKKKIQEEQGLVIVGTEDMSKEPTIMEETSLLTTAALSKKQSKSEEALSRTSQEVEQIIDQIRDPNFDCSLDDISAIIDGKTEEDQSLSGQNRGSPEFTTAVTMIEKNPDKGFDPDDPKVKNLEDWECSNLTASMESVEAKKSKFKNVLKRFSRHEETHSLLSDNNINHSNNTIKTRGYYYGDNTDEDQVSPSCIGTSLLYIFLKIFD